MRDSSAPIIIAVDGPAGSGKSSICAAVCRDLNWSYVNTGALYRAVAVVAADRAIPLIESSALAQMLREICDGMRWEHESAKLYFGLEDLTPRLHSVAAGSGASAVAKMPMVRDALMPLQRKLALSAPRGVIVDGRDIGTVVFPDADLKIFMTASLEKRAMRRLKQLEIENSQKDPGIALSHDDVMRSIAARDRQDSQRESAPLKQARDAEIFDTSDMNVDQAVEAMKTLITKTIKP